MESKYTQALSEVWEILKYSEKSIIEKIPQEFLNFIIENKDKEYKCNIDFESENWEESVKTETQSIIALIYRDYICSPEKRKILIAEEIQEQIQREEKVRKDYKYDDIFKNKKINILNEKNDTDLIQTKKQPWYKKIFEIFIRKNRI